MSVIIWYFMDVVTCQP